MVGIHGMLVDYHSMMVARRGLKKACFDVCLFNEPTRKYGICEQACLLNQTLQGLARKRPGVPIYFVTHSVGALVLRAALNLSSCPEEAKIGRAVLIAPPNQGSRLARDFKFFSPSVMH